MRIQAKFVRDGAWWVAWTDEVPGAISEGATVGEARGKLIEAIHQIWEIRGAAGADEANGRMLVEVLEV